MLKQIILRLLGVQKRIETLERKIEELSWDEAFGMWAKPAFLQFCRVMPRGKRIVCFIDLDRIHDLNNEFGYDEVDRRIRGAFSIPFRKSDVVARWYSGDEVVILFDSDREGATMKMNELEGNAARFGLTFKYAMGEWEVGSRTIEEMVSLLSDQVRAEQGNTTSRASE